MQALLCIRHAQSTMNAAGLWQGQADPPLSREGRDQARALALRLVGESLSLLVASDLARASETAEIAAHHLGITTRLEPGLRELDVGDWSGLSHQEIAVPEAERPAASCTRGWSRPCAISPSVGAVSGSPW
jgi:broad specificity phosphatase PhoE